MDFLLEAVKLENDQPITYRLKNGNTTLNETYKPRIVNGEIARRHIPWMAVVETREIPTGR